MGRTTPRLTGRLTRKGGTPGALPDERRSSSERSHSTRGLEETEVGYLMDPERYKLGGQQLYLIPGQSTEGPNSAPRIVCSEVEESREGIDDGRTSPWWKPAASKSSGKATKRPASPANPGIQSERDKGAVSPSKASRKKAAQIRPPCQKKPVKCPLCGKVCSDPSVFRKHLNGVHRGT